MKNLIDNANALIKQVQAINPEHALGAGFAANLRECAEALRDSMRSYARATAGNRVVGDVVMQVGTSVSSFDAIVGFIAQCVNDDELCPDIAHGLLDRLKLTVCTPEVAPDANVERNRQELLGRSKAGLQKYGMTTERDDLGLNEWAQHAIEEALDFANYLQAFKENLALLGEVLQVKSPPLLAQGEVTYKDGLTEGQVIGYNTCVNMVRASLKLNNESARH